ncbi:MFS family permease [Pantoea alhagi]|uniref:MFS transporter n=1 Tax=Mixta sp. BE291 TaxID=3158787 RepID=UPI00286749C7|nr:MFS family permease [Pantoea alhagi]
MNKLIISYINTSVGFWLVSFLVPLIILDMSNSAFMVTLSYAMNIIPYILITPFAGVLCDIYNRKHMIMAGELLCSATSFLLYIMLFYSPSVHVVLLLGVVISSLSAIHHPVFQSIIPDVTEKDKIKYLNAQVGMVDSLVSIIAPAILGVFLLGLSRQNILLVVVFCYFFSFITMLTVEYVKTTQTIALSVKNIMRSLWEGFVYVYNKKQLLSIACLFFFINIGIRVIFPNLLWIYSKVFYLTADEIALLFVVIGTGSIIGARIGARVIGRYSDLKIIMVSSFIIGLCSLMLIFATNALIHASFWAISSLVQSVIIVTFFTYRQKVTESFIIGRVVSVTRLIAYMAIPLASVTSGWILNHYASVNYIYIISGVCIFIALTFFAIVSRPYSK